MQGDGEGEKERERDKERENREKERERERERDREKEKAEREKEKERDREMRQKAVPNLLLALANLVKHCMYPSCSPCSPSSPSPPLLLLLTYFVLCLSFYASGPVSCFVVGQTGVEAVVDLLRRREPRDNSELYETERYHPVREGGREGGGGREGREGG